MTAHQYLYNNLMIPHAIERKELRYSFVVMSSSFGDLIFYFLSFAGQWIATHHCWKPIIYFFIFKRIVVLINGACLIHLV